VLFVSGEHGLRVGGVSGAFTPEGLARATGQGALAAHQARSEARSEARNKAKGAAKGAADVLGDAESGDGGCSGSSGVLEPADILELFAVPTGAPTGAFDEAIGGDSSDWRSTRSAMEASFSRR
jgi:hypothetical protein